MSRFAIAKLEGLAASKGDPLVDTKALKAMLRGVHGKSVKGLRQIARLIESFCHLTFHFNFTLISHYFFIAWELW